MIEKEYTNNFIEHQKLTWRQIPSEIKASVERAVDDHDNGSNPRFNAEKLVRDLLLQKGIELIEDENLDGPNVDLSEHRQHLSKALDLFLKHSQIVGFKESSHKPKIADRYSSDQIEKIGSGSDKILNKAYQEFQAAYGVDAMVEAGMTDYSARYNANLDATDFKEQHTGPNNRAKVKKLRSIIGDRP
ncbi:hypothetical protein HGB24_01275 [Candidatus Saccharibacteria bacterium]|nr:hypothetical protein [Candidatus Saccharibacteria bacterium]